MAFTSLGGSARRARCAAALVASSFVAAGAASALPLLSVDLDPLAPGVQTSAFLEPGATLVVAVAISGVEPEEPLHGFQLVLGFAEGITAPLGAALGTFLAEPVQLVQSEQSPDSVALAAVTLGPGAAFGEGVLAELTLLALAPGTTALALRDVVLAQPFGIPLAFELADAALTVVPEPGTTTLIGVGLVACAARSGAHWRRSA